MTTQQFYDFAVEAAKNRGYKEPSVTTISGCYNGRIHHSVVMYDAVKRKNINSGLQANPVAAIQAFKDEIEFSQKTYSNEQESIEI